MNRHSLRIIFTNLAARTQNGLLRAISFSLCLTVALTCTIPATAASPVAAKPQVLFLPFDVQITGSYSYLQNGLASTLASRLSSRANVAAVAQTTTSTQLAQALKKGNYSRFGQMLMQSSADYLVMGSLAPKDGQFELVSYVFTRTGSQAPKQFEQDFQSVDDAMSAVDAMAWDISGKVFNKPKPDALAGAGGNGMSGFQTAHPERAYREGLFSGSTTGLEHGGPFELIKSFRSKGVAGEAMDINVADLEGDGQQEILVLTKDALRLYRNDNGAFRMLATIDLPNHLNYHAITMADLNGNGLQEIYISASNGDNPEATVMEWDGRAIQNLTDHVPWYLATITSPGTPPLLVGQKSISYDFPSSELYTLKISNDGTIQPDTKLILPPKTTIFNFTIADINGDGSKEILTISHANRLQVFDTDGTLRWTSPDELGASNKFFGTLTSANNSVEADNDTRWIHTRIVITDLDRDGINDVLVGRNRVETVRFMPNLRYFDGASLAAYTWKDGSMHPLWETRKMPGYLTNYQVEPSQSADNQYSIFFVETESSYPFAFWQSTTSYLNCYTLQVNQ
nr:VCBS repeat-containing protein [uncultured Desulfobulbus sp.]